MNLSLRSPGQPLFARQAPGTEEPVDTRADACGPGTATENRPIRGRVRLRLVLLGMLFSTPAVAQSASPVCNDACAPSDLLCIARQQVCRSKLDVYTGYMARMGRGVVMDTLPVSYREILQPHFPEIDLGSYLFGYGDRQPPDNATTDCDRTYFGAEDFVDRLRSGELSTDAEFEWLFHELEHVQQCRRVGGRDHYAQMWFGDLEMAVLGSLNPLTLHERMRMERSANEAARRTLEAVRTLRDRQGRLTSPTARAGMNAPSSCSPLLCDEHPGTVRRTGTPFNFHPIRVTCARSSSRYTRV